jgi:hypothetical protein
LLAAAVAPLVAIDAMIAPEPAAQSGATHRSFCLPVRDHTARRVCAQRDALRSDRERHERNFCGRSKKFSTEPNTGPSDCRPRIAGDDSIAANLPPHFETEELGRSKRPTKRRRVAMKGGRGER